MRSRTLRRQSPKTWLFGWVLAVAGSIGAVDVWAGEVPAAPPASASSAPAPSVPATAPTTAAAAPTAPDLDFASTLRELRATLREVQSLREGAQKRGDKLKEACVYERQRAIAQAVDSTEQAQVSWETAVKVMAEARAQVEKARAAKAIELTRALRSAAETCVGEELRGASHPTQVTLNGPGPLDDPHPGPLEAVQPNLLRLELPSRPNPASAFRPTR